MSQKPQTPQPRNKSASQTSAKPHDAELIDAANEYLTRTKLSQNKFAKVVGKSATLVSQWLGGIYPGDVTEFEGLVRGVILREKLASLPRMKQIAETQAVRDVAGLLSRVSRTRGIAVLYGAYGCGKSAAVAHYVMAVERTAILLQLCRWSGSIAGVEGQFMEHFSRKAWQKGGKSRGEFIRSELTGHGRLVIVDGAENLTANARNWLLDMSSATGSGMVFVCGPSGDKFARSDARAAAAISACAPMLPTAPDNLAALSGILADCPELAGSLPALSSLPVGKSSAVLSLAIDLMRNSSAPVDSASALAKSAAICGIALNPIQPALKAS